MFVLIEVTKVIQPWCIVPARPDRAMRTQATAASGPDVRTLAGKDVFQSTPAPYRHSFSVSRPYKLASPFTGASRR